MITLVDVDGYHSDKVLEVIKTWNMHDKEKDIFEFVHNIWTFDMWKEVKTYNDINELVKHEYHISTGGWSGNESIIQALQENFIFWSRCWVQSNRDGHYIFHKIIK